MESAAHQQAARELWSARLEGRLLDALPDACRPETLADAYACQGAMDELGGPLAGWKIAATAAGGRAVLGVEHPFAGPLYERFRVEPGGEVAAGALRMGIAEAEFSFSLGRDLPASDAPHDRASVLAAVDAFVPSIEIPDTRYESHTTAGAPQLIADDACAGYFVHGDPVRDFDAAALPEQGVTVSSAGSEVADGIGSNVLDDPVQAVVWLANELPRYGRGLSAGEVVMTGAAAVVKPIAPGDELTADFGELGRVAVRFS